MFLTFYRDNPVASRLSLLYLLSLVLFGLSRQPFELVEEDFLEVINFQNDLSFDFGIRQRKKGNFVSIVFPYLKGVLLTNGSGHLLAKNQLASDGPTSVKPVDMPALNHWDNSFTQDRSLCLVRF